MNAEGLMLAVLDVEAENNASDKKMEENIGDDVVDVVDNENFESFDNFEILALCKMLESTEEDLIFAHHGYAIIEKKRDTVQGIAYLASKEKSEIPSNVMIKKVSKYLTTEKIAHQDGYTFLTDENIQKEAMILQYLTICNKQMGDYVMNFVDYFESDTHYYLVTENVDGMTLSDFIKEAHLYIRGGRLNLKDYRKIIKFITWQLLSTLYFLHDVYRCMSMSFLCT